MTESNRNSAISIQLTIKKLEDYFAHFLDYEGKIDIIKMSLVDVDLNEIIGLIILTGTWSNDPKELAKQIARLLAAQDGRNDLAIALAKLRQRTELA